MEKPFRHILRKKAKGTTNGILPSSIMSISKSTINLPRLDTAT